MCFDISSDESLFLALFVIVFMWDDQLRLLLIVTPRYFAFFCGFEGGVMKCVWEDNCFLFSVYSKNFTLVRVEFHCHKTWKQPSKQLNQDNRDANTLTSPYLTDINECASDPCHHNATCVDHVNAFSCVCSPGFTDPLCCTGNLQLLHKT